MTKRGVGPVILLACLFAGCAPTDLATYEKQDFYACFADQGAWAGEAPAAQYVRSSFDDFARHVPRFLDDLEREIQAAAATSEADWPRRFAPLHAEAAATIYRLGRLLPRMERALDVAPMIGQLREREIWWPRGNHHTEYLRVALTQEFVDHQNLDAHLAGFLTALEQVEMHLLALKADGGETDRAKLLAATIALREGWEGIEPGMRRVIFDRPDMPPGEALSDRLKQRVEAICASYSECGDEAGCAAPAASDGLTGEPMDDSDAL